jgi:hypothetical protein
LTEGAVLAIEKQIEIMRSEALYDPDIENRLAAARVINQAANTILNMKARVDEGSFRQRLADRMPDIVEKINLYKDKVPPIIEGSLEPLPDGDHPPPDTAPAGH